MKQSPESSCWWHTARTEPGADIWPCPPQAAFAPPQHSLHTGRSPVHHNCMCWSNLTLARDKYSRHVLESVQNWHGHCEQIMPGKLLFGCLLIQQQELHTTRLWCLLVTAASTVQKIVLDGACNNNPDFLGAIASNSCCSSHKQLPFKLQQASISCAY